MPKVEELDAELAAGLKQAKGKRMYFAVVVKGGADGALIVNVEVCAETHVGIIANATAKARRTMTTPPAAGGGYDRVALSTVL